MGNNMSFETERDVLDFDELNAMLQDGNPPADSPDRRHTLPGSKNGPLADYEKAHVDSFINVASPQNVLKTLPTRADKRKLYPLMTGCVDYFPLALAAVAGISRAGNDQHNPGEPLHWARSKSADHADCVVRHLIERGTIDTDGQRHTAKAAWRVLALLQEELEAEANWTPNADQA
jgi:hypothetical protein